MGDRNIENWKECTIGTKLLNFLCRQGRFSMQMSISLQNDSHRVSWDKEKQLYFELIEYFCNG